MSEPQEFLEGVPQGEGHFVKRTDDGYAVEAFFVNLGQARGGKRVARPAKRGGQPIHLLERDDLLFILDAKKRDWRKSRASASERGTDPANWHSASPIGPDGQLGSKEPGPESPAPIGSGRARRAIPSILKSLESVWVSDGSVAGNRRSAVCTSP